MEKTENQERALIKEESHTFDGAEYNYKLTVRISEIAAKCKLPLYSVEVTMKDKRGNTTKATCLDAFADIGRALVFFDKLVRYSVTPVDLAYVYEDDAV